MNFESSRSHLIITILLNIFNPLNETVISYYLYPYFFINFNSYSKFIINSDINLIILLILNPIKRQYMVRLVLLIWQEVKDNQKHKQQVIDLKKQQKLIYHYQH